MTRQQQVDTQAGLGTTTLVLSIHLATCARRYLYLTWASGKVPEGCSLSNHHCRDFIGKWEGWPLENQNEGSLVGAPLAVRVCCGG